MKKLHISQVDTIFANGSYPIEFLLYYRKGLKTEIIRSALKNLSSAFWPIFGEYDAGVIHYEKYSEMDCFDEDVSFHEFEADKTNQNIYRQYGQIIPSDLKKLFFLKLIQYKNGTVLIPKLNHLAGDGYSFFYFLSGLAAMSQVNSGSSSKHNIRALFQPHHRRTILREFQFTDIGLPPLEDYEDLSIELDHISKESVREKIKSIDSNFNESVSPNDILSAIVVKKSIEIQTKQFRDTFKLTIPIDVRSQIKEYGSKYFGNGLMLNEISFDTTDIKKTTIDEISVKIRKGMPEVNKENYIEYLKKLESIIKKKQTARLRPYEPATGCLVTNLSKMPTEKLNFGTGNPDIIIPLTVGKNSAAIMSDNDNYILRLVYEN